MPRILKLAQARRLRLVGDGQNLVDSTYIDNAAAAHLLTVDRLTSLAPCAGSAYFITNGEPLPIAELLGKFLRAARVELPPRDSGFAGRLTSFIGWVDSHFHSLTAMEDGLIDGKG